MRAVIAQDKKPIIGELPKPSPKADELLVEIKATALNRADLIQVMGNYPPPTGSPETLGLELAGKVIEIGEAVTNFKVGDRVMGLVGGGGYAEYGVVPATHCLPIPANFSYEQAAATPEVFLTAYNNMVEIGGLLATETVLIHAAASGVGLAAIQIAKAIGATVIATASETKHPSCLAHGADQMIDYQRQNFADVILADQPDGIDLIVDFIGAAYWDDNIRVLKQWGRLVFIGLLGGAEKEVNFRQIISKCLTISGSTMRMRSYERKTNLIGRFAKWAMPLFKSNQLKPTIWKTFALEEVEEAHRLMQDNQNIGKIVLTL